MARVNVPHTTPPVTNVDKLVTSRHLISAPKIPNETTPTVTSKEATIITVLTEEDELETEVTSGRLRKNMKLKTNQTIKTTGILTLAIPLLDIVEVSIDSSNVTPYTPSKRPSRRLTAYSN